MDSIRTDGKISLSKFYFIFLLIWLYNFSSLSARQSAAQAAEPRRDKLRGFAKFRTQYPTLPRANGVVGAGLWSHGISICFRKDPIRGDMW